jgi:acetyl-CoA synthetase
MSQNVEKKDSYEILYKNFKWNIPEYYNFGFDVVDQWAEDRTKLALISIDRSGKRDRYHTFFDLSVSSNQFANVLRNIGIKKGDRVLVILQSVPEWYQALIGMFKLGVIPMPGTVLLTSKDIEYRVKRAEANMVLTDMDHADIVEGIKDKCPSLKYMMLGKLILIKLKKHDLKIRC